jgi:hypothetical protein
MPPCEARTTATKSSGYAANGSILHGRDAHQFLGTSLATGLLQRYWPATSLARSR